MRFGNGNHWDTCGYARRQDVVLGGGVPVPRFSDELAKWVSDANVWALEHWGAYDLRIARSLLTAIPYIARFAVDGFVLKEDGSQFAAFSRNQLCKSLGWGNSRADRVLQACLLASGTTDYKTEEEARLVSKCWELRDEGTVPILERIEKGNGKVVSSWRLCGIEPLKAVVGPESRAAGPESFPTDPEFRTAGPESTFTPADVSGPAVAAPGPETHRDAGPVKTEVGPGGSEDMTGLSHISINLSSSEARDSYINSYARFLEAFGRDAGNRDAETYDAFKRRVRQGYAPEAIIAGAERYRGMLRVPGSDRPKWEYPLKFLEDDNHFGAVVPKGKQKGSAPPAGPANPSDEYEHRWMVEKSKVKRVEKDGTIRICLVGPHGDDIELPFDGLPTDAGKIALLSLLSKSPYKEKIYELAGVEDPLLKTG